MTGSNDFASIWSALSQTAFRQDYLDAGVRTRYIEAGPRDAPAVIMLHGTSGSWEGFCRNIGPYSQRYHCYAIDLVGAGFSGQPDHDYEIATYVDQVLAFMKAVGLDRAAFVGVSLGAWIASRLAVDHPDAVAALVLVSPAGLLANKTSMAATRQRRATAADDPTWEKVARIFTTLIRAPEQRIDDLIALRQSFYRRPDAKRTMEHILVLQDYDVRVRNLINEDEWRRIMAPTLAIGAVDDPNDALTTAQRIAELIPKVEYVEMHNVAHWAQFEDAETFNETSLRFLGAHYSA